MFSAIYSRIQKNALAAMLGGVTSTTNGWQRLLVIFSVLLSALFSTSLASAGQLSNVIVVAAPDTVGEASIYTVSFTLTQPLSAKGRVKLIFPSGFNLSRVLIAHGINIDGGMNPSVVGDTLIVSRDGSGKATTSLDVGVIFSQVVNRTIAGNNIIIKVETQKETGEKLDEGNSSGFTLYPGALQKFSLGNVPNVVAAGQNFSLTITAQDAYGNTVTSFSGSNGKVFLSDSTGTVRPKEAQLTNGTINLFPVDVTKVKTNNRITVSSNGKTSVSSSFNVSHGQHSKFAISQIGTQVAGVPFPVIITAQDGHNNTATSFVGTVNISATPGTIEPTQSSAFNNGASTQMVKFKNLGGSSKISTVLNVSDAQSHTGNSILFDVTAGEAIGEIKLAANPPVLPVNSSSPATITTRQQIKDIHNNPIGAGRLFTVVVSDTSVGKITTADADTSTPNSLQIKSSASSNLSFNFKAGKKGGVATIVVTGGANGSATGRVNLSVNELRILSVQADRDTVSARDKSGASQGRDSVRVNMVVQNAGQDAISLTKADLRFKDATGQTVLDHFFTKLESPSLPANVPGNFQTLNLAFSVLIDEDASGAYAIDGLAEAQGGAISDSAANITDAWFVQSPPKITYRAGSLAPKTASLGSSYQFYVRVHNAGQARLVLDTDKTLLRVLGEGGNTLLAKLDANGVRNVASGDTTLKFQALLIPANFPLGNFATALDIVGTHNGVPYSLSNILLPDSVTVKQAAELEIVNIIPSQNTVTQNMKKPWTITVNVRNNTGSTMRLDNVDLEVLVGGAIDGNYLIEEPTAFANNNGSVELEPDSTGSLIFRITQTGGTRGPAAVAAYVSTTILDDLYEAQSIGTQGSFLVQSPAALKIALLPSQARVTQSQTQDWFVTMRATNTGESDVNVQFGNPETALSFANNSGYVIAKRDSLEGAPKSTIKGGTTRDLIFNVAETGSDLGLNAIAGTMVVRENNSNKTIKANAGAAGDTSVTVETPARIVIDSTYLANVFNGERVNTGQQFQVRVRIKNLGEEKLAAAWVRLATNGNSEMAQDVVSVQGDSAAFNITAANDLRQNEIFTATIDSSVAANTKAKAQVAPAIDDRAQITIDNPANLHLVEIATDVANDTVAVNQEADWRVFVIVAAAPDSGNVIFDPPQALSLELNGAPQTDYKIKTPSGLRRSGLLLRGGERDTLVYVVQLTGRSSGALTLTAKIAAKDQNDFSSTFVRTGTKQVFVEGKTVAQIFKTRFASAVNQNGSLGFVNVAQRFPVEVDVQNLGPEQIEWAVVSLKKAAGNGQAAVVVEQDTLRAIPNLSNATATFLIDAGNTPSLAGDFEVFEARLDTARTLANSAKITHASPDTAVRVKIETPAFLQMSVATDPPGNDLSKGQTFKIRATIKNLGQAKFDNTGRLQILAPFPEGFTIFNNDPQPFIEDGSVEWTVTAPNNVAAQDTFLINLSTRPQDINSRTPVLAEKDTVALIVNVYESQLAVMQVVIQSPEGARDSLVSTEQRFVLKAKVSKSPNVNLVTAEFKPANGYVLADNEKRVQTLASEADSVTWRVVAPSNEDLGATELKVRIAGTNTSGEPVLPDSMSIPVRVQARANLKLAPSISEPLGAANGTLSLGQKLTLLAELNNNGSAGIYGEAKVKIDLGNTGLLLDAGEEEEKTLAFSNDRGQAAWRAQAPDTVSSLKPITFSVTQFPKDVNTNESASIEKKTVLLNVRTEDYGAIALGRVRIHEPEGAKDGTLSTEQVFTITADLSWNRADSVTARLVLPEGGFLPELLSDDLKRVFTQTPFWRIKAPTQALERAVFKIIFTAVDASNPELKLGPVQDSLALKFVRRADLIFNVEVTNPEAARDRVVSVSQPFEISAILENAGEAQVVGADSIRLLPLPEGYRLDGRETSLVKSSVALGNQRRASWWVIAPKEKSKNPPGETITMRLQNFALDENTGQAGRVDVTQKQTTVLTEEKRLQVRKLEAETSSPAARGQDSLAVLCLELKNTGAGESSSNILLKRVQLYVSKPEGAPLAPGAILRGVRVVNAYDHSQLFGSLAITPAVRDNPLVLEFGPPVVIGFETPQAIKVLASLTDTDSIAAFSLGFQSSADLSAQDQDSDSLVTVEDAQGRTGAAFKLNSGPAVLFEARFENFYNYPNPLGLAEGTSFIYTLPQDSDVSLEIYTLLGELVWKRKYSAAEAQGKAGPHNGDIVWDGRNGNGKAVLNGVYLAVLKTNQGTVMTKVAVIK